MRPFAILIAASLLLAGCTPGSEPKTAARGGGADRSVPVSITTVSARSLIRTLELGGVATASRSARLVPVGQGVVTKLPVRLGDEVQPGDLLAELDTSTPRLQLAQARARLELGTLQLADAERETARARTLAASGSISQVSLDKAESGLRLAQAQIVEGDASLAVIEDQIRRARLVAPFGGTITGIFIELGEFFTPTPSLAGAPALVALDALDVLRLDVHIPDVDLARVREGMTVVVRSKALPGQEFAARIVLIGAKADPGARTFLVRIRIPNADHVLRPGLFLTARVELERRDEVIVVPEAAVATRAGERFVMVLDGDRARQKNVTIGLRGDDGLEVSGVTVGEKLLIDGQFGLPDGSLVRVVEER